MKLKQVAAAAPESLPVFSPITFEAFRYIKIGGVGRPVLVVKFSGNSKRDVSWLFWLGQSREPNVFRMALIFNARGTLLFSINIAYGSDPQAYLNPALGSAKGGLSPRHPLLAHYGRRLLEYMAAAKASLDPNKIEERIAQGRVPADHYRSYMGALMSTQESAIAAGQLPCSNDIDWVDRTVSLLAREFEHITGLFEGELKRK